MSVSSIESVYSAHEKYFGILPISEDIKTGFSKILSAEEDVKKVNNKTTEYGMKIESAMIEKEFRFGRVSKAGFDANVGKLNFEAFKTAGIKLCKSPPVIELSDVYVIQKKPFRKIEYYDDSKLMFSDSPRETIYQIKENIDRYDSDFSYFALRLSKNIEIQDHKKELSREFDKSTDLLKRRRYREIYGISPVYDLHLTTVTSTNKTGNRITYEVELEVKDVTFSVDLKKILDIITGLVFVKDRNNVIPDSKTVNGLMEKYIVSRENLDENRLKDITPSKLKSTVQEMKEYSFSNKLNGVRYFLYITNKYMILSIPTKYQSRTEPEQKLVKLKENIDNFLIFSTDYETRSDSILDGEYFKGSFEMFDCLKIENKSVVKENFVTRFKYGSSMIEKLLNVYKGVNPKISPKPFELYDVNANQTPYDRFVKCLYKMYKRFINGEIVVSKTSKLGDREVITTIHKEFVEDNDGLVMIPNSEYYNRYSYKYKFIWLLSIDFLVKNVNVKTKNGINVKEYNIFSGDRDNTLINFMPDRSLETEQTNSMYEYIENGNIIEFLYRNRSFSPFLYRSDKLSPNYINTALAIKENIDNPIYLFNLLKELSKYKPPNTPLTKAADTAIFLAKELDEYSKRIMGLTGGVPKKEGKEEVPKKEAPKKEVPKKEVKEEKKEVPESKEVKDFNIKFLGTVIHKKREGKNVEHTMNTFHNRIKDMIIGKVFDLYTADIKAKDGIDRLYNILDIGAGLGGDVFKYMGKEPSIPGGQGYHDRMDYYDKLFLLEPKREHVVELISRLDLNIQRDEGALLVKPLFSRYGNKSEMNDIYKKQKEKLIQIKRDIIMARMEETKNILPRISNVMFISTFFSSTFFFSSTIVFRNLITLLDKSLMPGGYFYGTVMDGKEVYDVLEPLNNLTEEYKKEIKDVSNTKYELEGVATITKLYSNIKSKDRLKIGQKINIRMNDQTSITEQIEYLAHFDDLIKELNKIGITLVASSLFQPPSYMSEKERKFSGFNRFFIFKRTGILPALRFNGNNKTKAFDNLISKDVQLARTGVPGDGSCFFHSVLLSTSVEYTAADEDKRVEISNALREKIADSLDLKKYLSIMNGALSKGMFVMKMTVSVREFLEEKGLDEKEIDEKTETMNKYMLNLDNWTEMTAESKRVKKTYITDLADKLKTLKIRIDQDTIKGILNDQFEKYKEELREPGEWVTPQMIYYIQDYMKINILVIMDTTRTFYKIGDAVDVYNTAYPYIITINVSRSHYETVSQVFITEDGKYRLKTTFTKDCPIVAKGLSMLK